MSSTPQNATITDPNGAHDDWVVISTDGFVAFETEHNCASRDEATASARLHGTSAVHRPTMNSTNVNSSPNMQIRTFGRTMLSRLRNIGSRVVNTCAKVLESSKKYNLQEHDTNSG